MEINCQRGPKDMPVRLKCVTSSSVCCNSWVTWKALSKPVKMISKMLGLILKIRLMLLRIVTIAFFISNTTKIVLKKGVKALGLGVKEIAKAVTDCHMEEFAELLSALAIKLGIVPEVGWLEELLHILIEGVHIENE